MLGLFEAHDQARFETTAISYGPDSEDEKRKRLKGAFGRFIDVRGQSDRQTALLMRRLEIDIAVDLKGYTYDCRPGILAFRPSPVQVAYLGYPGTMGAAHIDYIIADALVIPEDQRACYTEKVVYLPHSYQANDFNRPIAPSAPTRREAGLPESGFVFSCFNNCYKIAPPVFDVWMRLLLEVEGSVLWLLDCDAAATRNLRRNAELRGVAANRLVFAPLIKNADHLARLRLADLCLDTTPYNAHTTASDALWAGLPVLTMLGSSFAGRVAGSLLKAVGLPELITDDFEGYEATALRLARDKSCSHRNQGEAGSKPTDISVVRHRSLSPGHRERLPHDVGAQSARRAARFFRRRGRRSRGQMMPHPRGNPGHPTSLTRSNYTSTTKTTKLRSCICRSWRAT